MKADIRDELPLGCVRCANKYECGRWPDDPIDWQNDECMTFRFYDEDREELDRAEAEEKPE